MAISNRATSTTPNPGYPATFAVYGPPEELICKLRAMLGENDFTGEGFWGQAALDLAALRQEKG